MLVEKQYNYLSEIPNFKLPSKVLINKGKVGCGGTTVALTDSRDTIVCVPFVNLIKNKCKQNKEVLGVYSGVTVDKINEYVETHKIKKIMCTYDQLPRLASIVGYNYFLLVDELHLLFLQYIFRDTAIRGVLNEYKNFKDWAFLTATPIESEFMLDELKDIPVYNIEWESKREITVEAIKCDSVKSTIASIIEKFLNNEIEGNAHIFVNSVKFIATMIKYFDFEETQCRAIWSKNNKEYKNYCAGIPNSDTLSKPKKINFYTSTCFEGCDLYDENGKIFIVSDSSKAQTLLDISTSIRQIAGRIRNTKYDKIYHLFSNTRYNTDLSYEEFKEYALNEAEEAKKYASRINSDAELLKGTKSSEYVYLYKSENGFEFDKNLILIDIFNYKNNNTYSLSVNMLNEYAKNNIKVNLTSDDKKIKIASKTITWKEYVKRYCELKKSEYYIGEELELIEEKYPFIKAAYELFGDTIVDMRIDNVKRAVIAKDDKKNQSEKIIYLLRTCDGFKEGTFTTGKKIKEILQTIYDKAGFNKKATISDFRNYAELKPTSKRIDGKVAQGYIITLIKTKYIRKKK